MMYVTALFIDHVRFFAKGAQRSNMPPHILRFSLAAYGRAPLSVCYPHLTSRFGGRMYVTESTISADGNCFYIINMQTGNRPYPRMVSMFPVVLCREKLEKASLLLHQPQGCDTKALIQIDFFVVFHDEAWHLLRFHVGRKRLEK